MIWNRENGQRVYEPITYKLHQLQTDQLNLMIVPGFANEHRIGRWLQMICRRQIVLTICFLGKYSWVCDHQGDFHNNYKQTLMTKLH